MPDSITDNFYIYEGDLKEALLWLEKKTGLKKDKNQKDKKGEQKNKSEWQVREFADLNVSDSRELKNYLALSGSKSHKKITVIKLRSININAQNALLKSLEDIKSDNIIVLVVDDVKIFLPTVLSRGIVIKGQREKNLAKREEDSDIDEFIEGNIVTRKSLADLWYKLKKKDPDILKTRLLKLSNISKDDLI
jgi:DNA polymerase III delta prime subunit